ncbi:peptide-methionine (R)-S-oxide reductase MsrB [Spirosoma taeanense]|uniref:peptide-methionine (R)-S-oxide reductase n=1 Tax=Spirosoma taeanense TaxID=2735870 RepID=A0A6M5Y799_9BACT|nr:peptide-methionine (R)-S-oxide reductase MsrB [Spirosoma taeanense]QJW88963.1 peptide-methionine (R)-S-oxide reductase MsrB [Spirosoma taeanense]
MKHYLLLLFPTWLLSGFAFLSACQSTASDQTVAQTAQTTDEKPPGGRRVVKTNAEWKKTLTPDQYAVLREHGTERAFTSPLNEVHEHGTFYCAGCHNPLFSSDTKFDSGTGWPSFYKPIAKNAVRETTDKAYGMVRTEVLCNVCGGHLGHVFDDGPKPTGLRYCMNGVAMTFEKK